MRILVLGPSGMLGRAVVAETRARSHEAFPFDHAACDVTDSEAVRAVIREAAPDAAVNCTAYTNVDGAESDEGAAFAVNAEGAGHVAEACRVGGVRLLHVSTDYVFDGRDPDGSPRTVPYVETDSPRPQGAYARSKRAGEERILEILPEALVVRTAGLYGAGGKNFVDTIRGLARRPGDEPLRVVDDQRTSPTWIGDLAGGLLDLLGTDATGIVHCTAAGDCSWYEFARAILEIEGIDRPVRPIPTSEFPRPAPRPTYSALDNTRFEEITGRRLRPWREGLRAYLGGSVS